MSVKTLILTLGLVVAVPAMAESGTTTEAARNAANLNILQAYYPTRALAAREQGPVGFQVKLDADGQPTECKVTQSSGYPLLDKETCDLITLRAVFKKPAGLSGSQVSTHQGVVNWQLPASMNIKTVESSKRLAVAVAPEKKVCKKTPRTGSLVASDRVCMTPSQWQKASDEAKEEWQALQGAKGTTSGN